MRFITLSSSDVQETMNKVVKAENEKVAAIDFASARETVADGEKRAKIKEAEGYKQNVAPGPNLQLAAKRHKRLNQEWIAHDRQQRAGIRERI